MSFSAHFIGKRHRNYLFVSLTQSLTPLVILFICLMPRTAAQGQQLVKRAEVKRYVTAMADRTVAIPTEVRRVVTLGSTPAINAFIFALGRGDTIMNALPFFTRSQS